MASYSSEVIGSNAVGTSVLTENVESDFIVQYSETITTTTVEVVNILLCFLHRLELTIYRLISLKSENIYFLPECVCVLSSHLFWTSGFLWTYHPGVTQEEGHTGLLHLPLAVIALIFVARRIQPFLSLVDRESIFCLLMIQSFSSCWAFLLGASPKRGIPPYFCAKKGHT